MILDQADPIGLRLFGATNGINTPIPNWIENYQAARRNMLAVDSPLSRNFELEAIWGPIIDEINETIGDQYRPTDDPNILGAFPDPTFAFGVGLRGHSEELYQATGQRIIDQVIGYENQNPGTFRPELIESLSLQALDQRARDNALVARDDFMQTIENSRGTGGVARFAGMLTGGLYEVTRDPLQFSAIALGGSGSLAQFAFREFMLNAGIEVMRQPGVAEWYGELGLDYTTEDFFRMVATSAVAGTGFAVGLRYGGRGVTAGTRVAGRSIERAIVGRDVSIFTRALDEAEPNIFTMLSQQQLREGMERMQAAGARNSADGQTAFELSQMMSEDAASNPGLPPSDHLRNLETSSLALAAGRVPEGIPELGPDILSPTVLERNQNDLESLGGILFEFDPRQIEVDAATFQFKSGGDEFGVTGRLLDVTEWNPRVAGVVTVYEYADGRLFIADGHQRVGLAKRLMAQDPSLKIQLFGYRLREVDGITPQEAMVQAALTNIAQTPPGRVSDQIIIDAAKVARIDPQRFEGLIGRDLSPTSQVVRQARDMMALTQDAFGAIINEVIDARYGAIVGRILADMPELQMPAIGVLNKADPANVVQAEAIVRQIRDADADVATQQSLFGDEMIVESLYVERARVLDRAIKQLRQDRAAFASLTRNAEEIEQAGNALNRETNQRRAQTDAEAISLIQTLANRKGPLSDALSAAARLARDSGQYATPTRQFVESVRRAIADGDFEGVDGGTVGSRVYDTPPSRRAEVTEEPSLAGFEEPTGHGPVVEQQLDGLTREMFPEEAAAAPEPAVRSPKEIEADLKARQPVETVDDIYELAPAAQDYIAGIGRQIQDELDVEFKNPGLKDIETAREKMTRKSYTSANQMTDISRAGFIVKNAADADAIAARFGRDAEILDEGWNVTPEGFFDRKILVRTSNGIISEIQIWSPELYRAKFSADNQFGKSGQDLYTAWRNEADPETKARLAENQRELYAAAINREDQSFRALLGIEMAPKVPSNADLNAASLAITRPVDQTSAASTGVQAPPGSRMATASLGETAIAGRPSQSASIIDQTPSGEQMVIPGAERITDIARAQEDLFAEIDPDMEIPSAMVVDPESGQVSMTMRTVKDMLDEEDSFIDRLGYCTR